MIAFACPSRPAGVCLCHRAASFTYFGEVLRCPHKRIVTITKVYIARNNIHVGLMRFRKKIAILLTLETLKWELGPIVSRLPCLRNWAHCYPGRVATVLCWWRRTFRDMTTSVRVRHFGTYSVRYIVTSGSVIYRDKHDSGLHNCTISSYYVYRQFAGKVGPSANSALISYPSLRL